MIEAWLDTRLREQKKITLLRDGQPWVENQTSGDVLQALANLLQEQGLTARAVDKLKLVGGSGSFTGLKVGAAIVNTFNFSQGAALKTLVDPDYGREPNITFPAQKS